MKINRIDNISFGIYKNTKSTIHKFGKVETDMGIVNNKKIEIYNAYGTNGKLEHKLYYLQDLLGNWLKSKLVYFSNGKKWKTLKSERR